MLLKGCSGAIRRCAASQCGKTCRSPTSPATPRCTAWKRPSCSTKSRKRSTSCSKSGPKPPTCCAAARSRGCSTSRHAACSYRLISAAEPQPKGATMEPMQTEKIPSNVQEMPGQEETLETLQNARQRLNETMATVKQRYDEACEYTDQVVRANPWSSIGVGFGILVGALVTLAASSRRSFIE